MPSSPVKNAAVAATPPIVITTPKALPIRSPKLANSLQSSNQRTHPPITVSAAMPVTISGTLRLVTVSSMNGPAAGPSFAAAGSMKTVNRNAEPAHATPPTMWIVRKTSSNGSAASVDTLLDDRPAKAQRTLRPWSVR